jgi:flagellar biosynthesis/type III secretory pathway protein FliH
MNLADSLQATSHATDSMGTAVASAVSMPRARLVKAKEFEAHLSAQAIRKRAEAHADQIVKETLMRAAEIEAAARIKGEQIGLQRYADALASLDQARGSFARDVESQLIASVFSVVRQLLPTLPAKLITEDIVIQLIRSDARSRAIQLIVPIAQVEYANSQLDVWRLAAGSARGLFSIEVKGKAQLDPDVCILKSEFGSVTASLSEQLAALEKSARAALDSSSAQPQSQPSTQVNAPRASGAVKAVSTSEGVDGNA